MKILFYQTNHRAEGVCISAMREFGCQVEPFSCPLQNEEQKERFLPLIRQLIREQHTDAIFSFDYFPALSEGCQAEGVLYISYCCDVPTMAMFEPELANPCNRILTADSAMVKEFCAQGASEVYYLPLAPVLKTESANNWKTENKIVFAGSLHEDNMYKYFAKLPDLARGYLDGIIAAQVHVYGYSLFGDLMGDDFWNTMLQSLSLKKKEESTEKYRYMIEHYFLEQQTTKLERSMILKRLSENYGNRLCFYTKEACSVPEVRCGGSIPYGKKLASIYQGSCIALNITNRARISGVPQNAWDILACGGFLLSNYQADFEGLLEPGKDFVVYGSIEELMDLTDYYLSHSEEREKIARSGHQKVLAEHTWRERAAAILSLIS